MRLGGPVFGDAADPERWASLVHNSGYSAAYCPVNADADDNTVKAYAAAAAAADIVIAEVGAWSNPISSDDATRKAAIDNCRKQLDLADRIGARCCVNIVGSRGQKWDGPDPADLTRETFDLIVETVRSIVDGVKPTRTFYTLETMPWMYPDSPDSYVELVRAIERPALAVHLDPTNLICSPQRYFANGAVIKECFEKLGRWIKSCHAKDIKMSDRFMVHLDEVRPGLGILDYRTFLREVDRLDPSPPVMLEHLPNEQEYVEAARYVRGVAREIGVPIQ